MAVIFGLVYILTKIFQKMQKKKSPSKMFRLPFKASRASETEEQRKERLRIRSENEKIENHEKQGLATLKRLKRGDDNELE